MQHVGRRIQTSFRSRHNIELRNSCWTVPQLRRILVYMMMGITVTLAKRGWPVLPVVR